MDVFVLVKFSFEIDVLPKLSGVDMVRLQFLPTPHYGEHISRESTSGADCQEID